jgi:hypothetical protein
VGGGGGGGGGRELRGPHYLGADSAAFNTPDSGTPWLGLLPDPNPNHAGTPGSAFCRRPSEVPL